VACVRKVNWAKFRPPGSEEKIEVEEKWVRVEALCLAYNGQEKRMCERVVWRVAPGLGGGDRST
jgi:hypothetical protein